MMSNQHTPAERLPRVLAWIMLLAFILLELALVTGNLLALKEGGYHKSTEQGWHDFIHGAPMRALAEDLRSTPLAHWLGQRQRELAWLVFEDLGPRVRQGCPGWLFLTDELTLYPQAAAHTAERTRLALEVAQVLKQHGHDLLIALVPDKTRIETDHLCGIRRPAAHAERGQRWLQDLRAQGVESIDLTPPLLAVKAQLGSAFYRSDTHWHEEGAEAAAKAIASQMLNLGFTPQPWRDYQVQRGSLQPRWGDLIRLAGLDELPERLRPPPDQIRPLRVEIKQHAPAQGEDLSADTLFADHDGTRVSLVGTSFSRNAGFADFLAASLHTDIGNLARDGGGFAQSMQQFLERELAGPGRAWVIWEIPERVLGEPLGEAEQRLSSSIAALRVARKQQNASP